MSTRASERDRHVDVAPSITHSNFRSKHYRNRSTAPANYGSRERVFLILGCRENFRRLSLGRMSVDIARASFPTIRANEYNGNATRLRLR